jgi:hypothetical protein
MAAGTLLYLMLSFNVIFRAEGCVPAVHDIIREMYSLCYFGRCLQDMIRLWNI